MSDPVGNPKDRFSHDVAHILLLFSRVLQSHAPLLFQVGENGAGKTTLLKILLGELSPTKGVRHAHRNLRIGYFSQHHVDQLDMSLTSVELLAQRFPGKHCYCLLIVSSPEPKAHKMSL